MRLARALPRLILLALALSSPPSAVAAQYDPRVSGLEQRLQRVEEGVENRAGAAALTFLFGAFCALWAQNTGRNPWLWFVLGLFFSVVTVIFLLSKNASDRRRSEPPRFDLEQYRVQ